MMFPTMQTRILNIRASQSSGTISFSGVFTGFRDAEQTSVSLNVDPEVLEIRQSSAIELPEYDSSLMPVADTDI